MEQVPRADGPPVGECSVEQATRAHNVGDPVAGSDSRGGRPVPFAVPERLAVVDSTNRYLARLANDAPGLPDGYAVVADYQTDGRGRLGRSWVAPPGTSVLCSILLRADLGPEQLHLAAWAVALAAVRACRAATGAELALKWPNDLIAGTAGRSGAPEPLGGRPGAGRKVAGILSEVLAPRPTDDAGNPAGPGPWGIVVGIGINVNWPAGWPPVEATDPELASIAAAATSLNRLAGREIDRDELVAGLLQATGSLSAMLSGPEGRRTIASRYRRCCATIGREVRVQLGDEIVTGRALDVDDAGCLLVSGAACIRAVSAGDVVHLR